MSLDTPEGRLEYVENQMVAAVQTLEAVCPLLKREFKVKEKFDGEQLLVEIDNIPFCFTWTEQIKWGIGLQWVIKFQLLTFYQTAGDRRHPPETMDVELMKESSGVHPCVRKALETVAGLEIKGALEAESYKQMVVEEY